MNAEDSNPSSYQARILGLTHRIVRLFSQHDLEVHHVGFSVRMLCAGAATP